MSKKPVPQKPIPEEKKDPSHPQEKDNKRDEEENDKQESLEKKDMENTKFQSLPLREYYDHAVTSVLLEGLRELGRQRYIYLYIYEFLI